LVLGKQALHSQASQEEGVGLVCTNCLIPLMRLAHSSETVLVRMTKDFQYLETDNSWTQMAFFQG